MYIHHRVSIVCSWTQRVNPNLGEGIEHTITCISLFSPESNIYSVRPVLNQKNTSVHIFNA